MDGTTEPIIAVIGHPIAGNPSQLAIERALSHLRLEWRVLSFDVPESDVPKALDGFSVLSIKGVLIDASLVDAASKWERPLNQSGDGGQQPNEPFDCLNREAEGELVPSNQLSGVITKLMEEVSREEILIIDARADLIDGEDSDPWLATIERQVDLESSKFTIDDLSPEKLSSASRVVIPEHLVDSPDEAEWQGLLNSWKPKSEDAVMIDLRTRSSGAEQSLDEKVTVVRPLDLQTRWLVCCLKSWTDLEVPPEVISEAIEEYTGV